MLDCSDRDAEHHHFNYDGDIFEAFSSLFLTYLDSSPRPRLTYKIYYKNIASKAWQMNSLHEGNGVFN